MFQRKENVSWWVWWRRVCVGDEGRVECRLIRTVAVVIFILSESAVSFFFFFVFICKSICGTIHKYMQAWNLNGEQWTRLSFLSSLPISISYHRYFGVPSCVYQYFLVFFPLVWSSVSNHLQVFILFTVFVVYIFKSKHGGLEKGLRRLVCN